jgi:hypothetical protein
MKFALSLATFLATTHSTLAQTVLLSVPLNLDGREVSMDLWDVDESVYQSAARTIEGYGLGAVVEGDQYSPLAQQLAQIMQAQIDAENAARAPKSPDPIASFSVQGDDGQQYQFSHFEGNDVNIEAQQFCQQVFPSIGLQECANQLIAGADQVLRQTRRANRNVVFRTTVEINGQQLELAVAEGENAATATAFFCEDLELDAQNNQICMNGITPVVEASINQFMQELAAQQAAAAAPLFELPMKIGDKILPLAFSLSEHPRETTMRFCADQWAFISTVLQSGDPNIAIDQNMCADTLFDLVVGVIDELLGSEEGLQLAAAQRLFKIDIELTPEPGTPASAQTLDLNVFPGQSAEVAVDNFLRRTGISKEVAPQLIEMVRGQM